MRVSTAYALLLCLAIFALPGEFGGGAPSIEYLKQLGATGCAVVLMLYVGAPHRQGGVSQAGLLLCIALVGYATLSLTWSISLGVSLRYINKLWLTAAVLVSARAVDPDEWPHVLRVLLGALTIYLLLTVAAEFTVRDVLHPANRGDPRLVGFGGIHHTKYLMAVLALLTCASLVARPRLSMAVLFSASVLVAILSLQRALVFSMIAAIALVAGVALLRRHPMRAVILLPVAVALLTGGAYYVAFRFAPVSDRMFLSPRYAALAEKMLVSGDVQGLVGAVHMRGRTAFWQAALSERPPALGFGFGTVGLRIQRAYGEYWEAHNDYIKLYVELGIPGLVLYVSLAGIVLFGGVRLAVKSSGEFGLVAGLAAAGCIVIALVNGIFDNALDHVHKTLLVGMVMLVAGNAWLAQQSRRIGEGGN